MAIFIIKQKTDPSYKKNVIDIHTHSRKNKKYFKISLCINILLLIGLAYTLILLNR